MSVCTKLNFDLRISPLNRLKPLPPLMMVSRLSDHPTFTCLSQFGLRWQIATGWAAYTTDTYLSPFWRLGNQDQIPNRSGVWWGPSSSFGDGRLLLVSSLTRQRAAGGSKVSWISPSKGTNPIQVGPSLWPNHLSNPYLLIPSYRTLEFQNINRGESEHNQSITL